MSGRGGKAIENAELIIENYKGGKAMRQLKEEEITSILQGSEFARTLSGITDAADLLRLIDIAQADKQWWQALKVQCLNLADNKRAIYRQNVNGTDFYADNRAKFQR